jgi:pimeloyl-ACP methyl ester carboxylesterase
MRQRRALASLTALTTAALLFAAWHRARSSPVFNTLEPEQVAEDGSQFVDLHGIRVHVKIVGHGAPVLVLLHGFAASTFTWHKVIDRLAQVSTDIAFDRPGFGLTSRPVNAEWNGSNPYDHDAQADLAVELLDHLGIEQAILVGHSAGGTVAALTALRHPDRVESLVLIAPAIYSDLPPPVWLRPVLDKRVVRFIAQFVVRTLARATTPIMNHAWHDPRRITPDERAGYTRPFHIKDWDKSMVEIARANRPHNLAHQLAALTLPVLVVTGDDDHVIPTAQSRRLALDLPHAELKEIPDCGHIPQEEKPEEFLQAILPFINRCKAE